MFLEPNFLIKRTKNTFSPNLQPQEVLSQAVYFEGENGYLHVDRNIGGVQGPQGIPGLTIPGWDGENGTDSVFLLPSGLRFTLSGAGQVVYTAADLSLKTEAAFTYNDSTDTLSVTNAFITSLTNGRLVLTGASDALVDSASFNYTDTATQRSISVTGSGTTNNVLSVSNTSGAGTSIVDISTGGTGDAYVSFGVVAGTKIWAIGADVSDANALLISENTTLGTNNRLRIATGGAVSIAGSLTVNVNLSVLGNATLGDATTDTQILNGVVLVNHTASVDLGNAVAPKVQVHGIVAQDARMGIYRWTADAGAAALRGGHSRGASAGTHTIVQADDTLFNFAAFGSDGVQFIAAGSVQITCDGTPGVDDMPGRIDFFTTSDGATTGIIGARLDKTQDFQSVMGLSTTLASQVTIPSVNTTAVGNVGTGEDDLMTYTLPANALSAAGKGLRVTAWGSITATSATKTVKMYFGGTLVMTLTKTLTTATTWRIILEIFSTGVDAQDYICTIQDNVSGATAMLIGSLVKDDGAGIIIKCTGESSVATNNLIVQEGMFVEHLN